MKEKFYYHGSKNCNWGSIIINSLSLHPNAAITGKMLGNGIYFAPSAMKSWGYISAYGSYWAHGNSSTGIMGIYKVAEDSLDVTNNIRQYSPRELGTHNSVYAARGGGMRCVSLMSTLSASSTSSSSTVRKNPGKFPGFSFPAGMV